jgi:hypothetical protein
VSDGSWREALGVAHRQTPARANSEGIFDPSWECGREPLYPPARPKGAMRAWASEVNSVSIQKLVSIPLLRFYSSPTRPTHAESFPSVAIFFDPIAKLSRRIMFSCNNLHKFGTLVHLLNNLLEQHLIIRSEFCFPCRGKNRRRIESREGKPRGARIAQAFGSPRSHFKRLTHAL